MCGQEERLKVHSFFIMDENFLLQASARMRTAGAHEARAEELGPVRLFVGQRDSQVHHGGAGGAGRLLDLDGAGIAAVAITPSCTGTDTVALTRELREHGIKLLGSTIIGLEHHTPGEHPRGDRARDLARHRLPPVHAVHAGAGHAAVQRDASPRDACSDVDLADIHGQDSSISSTPPSRARIPSGTSTRRSCATSNGTGPACSASAAPLSRAGNDIVTTRTRACGNASRASFPACATPTRECYGPWNAGCAIRINP